MENVHLKTIPVTNIMTVETAVMNWDGMWYSIICTDSEVVNVFHKHVIKYCLSYTCEYLACEILNVHEVRM